MKLDISLIFLLSIFGQTPYFYNDHPTDLLTTLQTYYQVIKLLDLPTFQAYLSIVFIRLIQLFLLLLLRAKYQLQGWLGPGHVSNLARLMRLPMNCLLN